MRISPCCNAPIVRHKINKNLLCTKCTRIVSFKTKIYHISEESEKVGIDPFFKNIDKPIQEKKPRIITEAQLCHIRKKEEQKEGERINQLRKERNARLANSINHD